MRRCGWCSVADPDALAEVVKAAEWAHDGVAPGFDLPPSARHAWIARAVLESPQLRLLALLEQTVALDPADVPAEVVLELADGLCRVGCSGFHNTVGGCSACIDQIDDVLPLLARLVVAFTQTPVVAPMTAHPKEKHG